MKNKVKGMEFFSAPGGTPAAAVHSFLLQPLHLGLLLFKIILCDAAI
jgi:hypothetical protein